MAHKLSVLSAQNREEFGKGASRRLRRKGRVPAVVYGLEETPAHVSVDILELTKIVRNHGVNTVITLNVDGEERLAMIKAVDQNVLTLNIDHADFMNVKRGEKVIVDVPVLLTGEPMSGTLAVLENATISVEADVLSIPEEFELSVDGLEQGAQILAGDITMPKNVTLETAAEELVVNIVDASATAEESTETEAPEEAGEESEESAE